MKKTWTDAEIKELLRTNDKAVYRALIRIYSYQTEEEQALHETSCKNGKGFNGIDAPIMSSFAEFFNRTGFLTEKQMKICRKKIMKYSKQLLSIANA